MSTEKAPQDQGVPTPQPRTNRPLPHDAARYWLRYHAEADAELAKIVVDFMLVHGSSALFRFVAWQLAHDHIELPPMESSKEGEAN